MGVPHAKGTYSGDLKDDVREELHIKLEGLIVLLNHDQGFEYDYRSSEYVASHLHTCNYVLRRSSTFSFSCGHLLLQLETLINYDATLIDVTPYSVRLLEIHRLVYTASTYRATN